MFKQKQIQKNPPRLAIMSIMAIATAVILVFTVTPWNFVPIQVTEDITVLGITEHGCVGESQYGTIVVVPNCSAQVGQVVSATFYVPAMEINSYYEKLQNRVDMVQP
ncbi:MAG: hypothetical protein R3237_06610 [Nitrosopumilaceae archaeon]|nr:hypothetical protein [Nitrosopumilaceae archaeon]